MKIMVDLDVITVAEWEKKDPRKQAAKEFEERIKKKEFEALIPSLVIKRILDWKHAALRDKIEDFYIKHTAILTDSDIEAQINKLQINDENILKELEKAGVKSEDAFLVLVTSVFGLDYLVTFNRKHLKNKKDAINNVLRKFNLKEVEIVEPNEI